ncbi:regulatory protein RecX [Arthrobacter zhaoxinii]|uniref:regulatory protein RecX n=1 Tax=Arthrobacter zhaoxinii TaxID=2964616 RepID=UPI0028BF5218|nr:regulatory protein RecX [Arthrobacter zhaoxinii]
MDTSQQETLAELKRRLADIAAGTADAEAADSGTDARSARKERAAAGEAGDGTGAARPSRRRRTAAKTPDAFKEDGFGEEAPADEPWAEAAVGEETSGRKRGGKKPGRQWGRQGSDREEPDPQSPDQEPEPLSPEEAYAEAKAIVLRQLTASPKSRRQLETKLAEREIPPDAAAAVLDRFEEVQLVDDAEFARLWVRSRSQSKSLARGALRRELTEKGIAPDLADEALEQLSADDELEAARSLARKKLQASADLSDRSVRDKQTRRLVGMLARKGYSPSLGFRVAAEVISEVRDTRSDSV